MLTISTCNGVVTIRSWHTVESYTRTEIERIHKTQPTRATLCGVNALRMVREARQDESGNNGSGNRSELRTGHAGVGAAVGDD